MRRFEADDVREDPPEDPPEDFATTVHTCGWNGSLRPFKPTPMRPARPSREVADRLQALRAELAARAEQGRARGLHL